MTTMKPIAVIILNWNGQDLLRKYLPQVLKNTDSTLADVIVADNGSTDNSLNVLKNEFSEVKTIIFPENYGFAEGYNKAIEQTRYKYTVLLNSDVAPAGGWIRPLYECLEENDDVAAVQPKVLSDRNRDYFEHAGAAGGFIDVNGFPYCRGRIMETVEKDEGQYNSNIEIFWASGAALTIKTEAYLSAGGLDSKFFAHMEEIDLCWRVLLTGKKIMAVTSSVVYHLGGASLAYNNPRKTYLNFRNNLLMMHKNLPDSTRSRKLFVRRLIDTVAWAKYVATLDFKNARAIFKAHRDFIKMRKEYTSHPDVDLLDKMPMKVNIILSHYLKGVKYFSQLKK